MLIDTGIVCRLWLFKPSHYQHSRANLFARSGIAGSWISVGLRFKGATKLFPKAVVLLFTLLLMIIERSACPSSSPNPLHYPSFQFYSLLTDPWLFSPLLMCLAEKPHLPGERVALWQGLRCEEGFLGRTSGETFMLGWSSHSKMAAQKSFPWESHPLHYTPCEQPPDLGWGSQHPVVWGLL